MKKIIFCKNNIPYDLSSHHAFQFVSEAKRDEFLKTIFEFNNNINELFNDAPEIQIIKDDSITLEVEFRFQNENNFDPFNKNYCAVQIGNIVTFYWIESAITIGNYQKFKLKLKWDWKINLFNFIYEIENFNLLQGHSPITNYFGYGFDGGEKKPVILFDIPLENPNELRNNLKAVQWLLVPESVDEFAKYFIKTSRAGTLLEPIRWYIAPATEIDEASIGGSSSTVVWTGNEAFPFSAGTGNTADDAFKNSDAGENKTIFQFSQPIDTDGIQFVYDYDGFTTSRLKVTTVIKAEQLPQGINEEKLILLGGFDFIEGTLNYFNDELSQNGIIPEDFVISNTGYNNGGFLKDEDDAKYIPVFIKKISSTIYEIRNARKSEVASKLLEANIWFNYEDGTQEILYYKNYSTAEGFGMPTIYSPSIIGKLFFKEIKKYTFGKWNAQELLTYYSDPQNTSVYGVKITSINPYITEQTEGIFDLSKCINVKKDEEKNLYYLTYIDFELINKQNTLRQQTGQINRLEFLTGLNEWSIVIENIKEIELDVNDISENNELIVQRFASFTPEWEERVKFVSGKFLTLTNDNNSWSYNKTLIKGSDSNAEYKSSNPVTSKLEYLKPLTNPVSYLNPTSLLLSETANLTGTFFHRQNLKQKPDSFTGTGDMLGDLIFNEKGLQFSLLKSEFTTPTRNGIIENIKRNGVSYDFYFVKDFNEIKRPVHNFIRIDSLNNTKVSTILTGIRFQHLAENFQSGIQIWHDPDDFLNWEKENGDN